MRQRGTGMLHAAQACGTGRTDGNEVAHRGQVQGQDAAGAPAQQAELVAAVLALLPCVLHAQRQAQCRCSTTHRHATPPTTDSAGSGSQCCSTPPLTWGAGALGGAEGCSAAAQGSPGQLAYAHQVDLAVDPREHLPLRTSHRFSHSSAPLTGDARPAACGARPASTLIE